MHTVRSYGSAAPVFEALIRQWAAGKLPSVSDFVAFFPPADCARPPASFSRLSTVFYDSLQAEHVQIETCHGAPILHTRSAGRAPRFYAQEDGAGWVVVKGQIFDVGSESLTVDLQELLHNFLAEDLTKLNRYEGAFALAAWDARKRQGWAVNDQASILNLYYGEYDGGLYVSTNAASLARALRLELAPHGVQELLARNVLLAPTTMFAGLRRPDIGEHIRYQAGVLSSGKHWYAYEPQAVHENVPEAANTVATLVIDRIARYAASANPVVADLTSGLDSRLVASATQAAGVAPSVTVNGPPDSEDVRIAHQLAETMHWDLRYFNTDLLWEVGITPKIGRDLLYRSGGELPFTEVYHHLLTRPRLARDFGLHFIGSGGELLRYFPWGQEFFGIGRRQLANANRVLDYRFLTTVPSPSIFAQNWLPTFRRRLKSRIEAVCREQPGTLTTQQLDAVYVWKMTSHSSLYVSSVYNWLPSCAPLLSAGVIKAAIALPWKMRLTSKLERQIIYTISPRAAGVVTAYGATANPSSFKEPHLAALQATKRSAHLVKKLNRVLSKRILARNGPPNTRAAQERRTFLAHEFREILQPKTMLSRRLYSGESLRETLNGSGESWRVHASLISRLATIELLCRELDFEPEEDFLSAAPNEPIDTNR